MTGLASDPRYLILPEGKIYDTKYDRYRQTMRWQGKRLYVRHAVALLYLGPCPPGLVLRYRDGNKKNASVSNLYYGKRKGRKRKYDYAVIIKMLDDGSTEREVAAATGMSRSYVHKLKVDHRED